MPMSKMTPYIGIIGPSQGRTLDTLNENEPPDLFEETKEVTNDGKEHQIVSLLTHENEQLLSS